MRLRTLSPEISAARAGIRGARPGTIGAVLLTFTVIFIALSYFSYSGKSATWDEPIHLTAGYLALAAHDYRVDPSHPPFQRIWAALPLLAMPQITMQPGVIDATTQQAWLGFARDFMYTRNDGDRMLYAARFMVVLLGVATGILLFFWVFELLGFRAAACALVFFVLSPNIIAHARLVTTDMGVTCFTFGAVYFLWRTCRRPTTASVAGLTVFFTLAIVTKYSGLLLIPIVGVLLAVAVWRRIGIDGKVALAVASLLAVGTTTGIWAIYGFRFAPSASPLWLFKIHAEPLALESVPRLAAVVGWVDAHRLLPNAFTEGALHMSLPLVRGNHAYLLGSTTSSEGWWYYFPVTFLVKTPVPLLLLLMAGIVVCARDRRLGLENEAFLFVPVAGFMAAAMVGNYNIGLRHILPVYPFLLIVAAAAGDYIIAKGSRPVRFLFAGLIGFWALSFANVYPHMLTFFNALAGGPHAGFRYLSDSNLDWGQDIKPLKQWMERNRVGHVNLAYFGEADPDYYKINCTYLPGSMVYRGKEAVKPRLPGYVALSATVLSGTYLEPKWKLFYRPFLRLKPVANIGHSIRVYWVDQWPVSAISPERRTVTETQVALADALLFEVGWAEQAVVHYRAYLQQHPTDPRSLANLGVALLGTGDVEAGLLSIRRAVELDPGNGGLRRDLANALLSHGNPVEACFHAQQAVAMRPADPAALDMLGEALALQNRWQEAAEQFTRALDLNPDYNQAQEHLARIQPFLEIP